MMLLRTSSAFHPRHEDHAFPAAASGVRSSTARGYQVRTWTSAVQDMVARVGKGEQRRTLEAAEKMNGN